MALENASASQWDLVASELRAYRDQQKQTWGDLDCALLGRYLAGEADEQDRLRVEAGLEQHPELRHLTDLVRDVLDDCQPAAAPIAAETSRPRILPFTTQQKPSRKTLKPARSRVALLLAASLLMGLGLFLYGSSKQGGTQSPLLSNSLTASRANRDRTLQDEKALARHEGGHTQQLREVSAYQPFRLGPAAPSGSDTQLNGALSVLREHIDTLAMVANADGTRFAGLGESAFFHADVRSARTEVRDHAKLLNENARRNINACLSDLSDRHQFPVVVETLVVATTDKSTDGAVRKAAEQMNLQYLVRLRSRQVAPNNGMYVLICEQPPLVQVTLGDKVRHGKQAETAATRVRQRLERAVQDRNVERDLELTIRELQETVGKAHK